MLCEKRGLTLEVPLIKTVVFAASVDQDQTAQN